MRRAISIINGKLGGRPQADSRSDFIITGFSSVILTKTQYDKLLERHGSLLLNKALQILENWLDSSPKGIKHRGKNNYAHFRSDGWLINEAKQFV